jgi:hypothetical protein
MTLTRDEMVDILEEIAREGSNAAARIAAIKQLEAMRLTGEEEEQAKDDFDDLATKRSQRAA